MYFACGLIAGTSITCAILLSTLSDVAGGIISTFPSIFLTTMFTLWLSQGNAVPCGAVGPMMLGSSSVSFYAMVYRYLCRAFSPNVNSSALIAIPITWIVAVVCISFPCHIFLTWRRSVSADMNGFDHTHKDIELKVNDNDHHVSINHVNSESPGGVIVITASVDDAK
jgi:hypothetical protein